MKIMTGLMRSDSGDVMINGFSIHDYTNAMKNVGCIIESVNLFPYLSGYENMTLCARFHGISKKRIEECLEMTGILKYQNEKIRDYSLGMKQRIGLAMAILPSPSVLILDEPLNGLDIEGMVEMRNLILRLSKENGATFFISSHLIHDVELTCDRIGILHEGKLLRVESMDNILQNFSSLENFYLSEVDVIVNSANAN
jgi:ABC-2 type transport system ATP-binding protein